MIKIVALLLTFFLPFFFFLTDGIILAAFHTPLLQALPVFMLLLALQPTFFPSLIWCFFLLGLFSCAATGLTLPYMAFVAGILLLAKAASFYTPHRLLLSTGTVILLSLASLHFLETPFSPSYTMGAITGNLIVMYISLKWFSAVKRGNRP